MRPQHGFGIDAPPALEHRRIQAAEIDAEREVAIGIKAGEARRCAVEAAAHIPALAEQLKAMSKGGKP